MNVIDVGSIENTYFPVTYTGTDSKGGEFRYASVWPINRTEELDVLIQAFDPPFGCTWDTLNDTFNKVDVKNTLVFIYASQCTSELWRQFNFTYLGLLNDGSQSDPWANEYNLCPLTDENNPIHLISIGGNAGKEVARIREDYNTSGGYGKYKMRFGNPRAASIKQTLTGGMMSNFSSFGPSIDTWAMKPEISAPGGNILATFPLGPLGGYTVISGTSMATAFMTGCYALVKSKFPHLSVIR